MNENLSSQLFTLLTGDVYGCIGEEVSFAINAFYCCRSNRHWARDKDVSVIADEIWNERSVWPHYDDPSLIEPSHEERSSHDIF